jgi:hypothetical protein
MNRTFKLSAVAVAAFIAAPAFAAAALDANLEYNLTSTNNGVGVAQGGRVEVGVSGKAGGDAGFVAGRAVTELQGAGGSAVVADMWGQIGTSTVDVKFGKFEAIDLFPVGRDINLADAGGAAGYRANTLRGRIGTGAAHAALTVNAVPGVSFELGLVESKNQTKGLRPIVSFKAGPAAIKLGLESANNVGAVGVKQTGFSATVAAKAGPADFNLTATSGTLKAVGGDVKSKSFGANANIGALGLGYISDKTDGAPTESNFYINYGIPVFNTGAVVSPAFSTARASGLPTVNVVSVRVNYAF